MELELLMAISNETDNICENETVLTILMQQERQRRIQFESSIQNNIKIITEIDGTKYKIRENGKIWEKNNPCVICDDANCLQQIRELTLGQVDQTLCRNPLNAKLLKMLCQWRKHIKETFIENQQPGTTKWKKTSICTSELTFLGRKTEIGGIIGTVSKTTKHICSLETLVSLIKKEEGIHNGVKGLSIGFAVLIAMYMNWDLYTAENVIIVDNLLKKIRKNGMIGNDTYKGSPWYSMFKCLLERRSIPEKLKEYIISRAHMP